jgi:hypothetical protein
MKTSVVCLRSVVVTALSVCLAGCGALTEAKKADTDTEDGATNTAGEGTDTAEKAKGSLNLADIQLKSASLLATHSENVFGPGLSIVPGSARGREPAKSVFALYQNNFGSEAGLSVGDKFGDAPTEAYFMGLAIAGETIARNCETDLLTKKEESKCKCDDEESAKALLGRAFSQWDFETAERKQFVAKVVKGCQEAYASTINGMVMSLAYALRR